VLSHNCHVRFVIPIKYYREQASAAGVRAKEATCALERSRMLALADAWTRMASYIERKDAPTNVAVVSHRGTKR
jgi:hypothetical protein